MKKVISVLSTFLFGLSLLLPGAASADEAMVSQQELQAINQDLMGQIKALQSKLSSMDSRLSATERQSSRPAYVPSANTDGGVLKTLDGTTLSGYVDTSYTFNFDRPSTQTGQVNNQRVFDDNSDSFLLNAVELNLEKLADKDGGVGFRFDLQFGEDPFVVASDGTANEIDLQQGYIEINAPINGGDLLGNNVNIKVGKFVTLAGMEVIESKDNWNFSRSNAFARTIPFQHTGIRTNWSILDGNVDLTLGLNNGWDVRVDANRSKTWELGVGFDVTESLSYYGTIYLGGEPDGATANDDGARFLNTNVFTWVTPIEKLTLASEINVGNQRRVAGLQGATDLNDAQWFSTNLYAKYDINDKMYVAYRYEIFADDDTFRAGTTAESFSGQTITLDYRPYDNLITRGEIRLDRADSSIFEGDSSQVTLGGEVIYLFG